MIEQPAPTESAGRLTGARIGILEGRMGSQLADMVRRQGGVPVLAPALSELPLDASAAVDELIDKLSAGSVRTVVFLTGVGAAALFREAARIRRLEELVQHLSTTTNVSRGQKPWKPLKEHGIPISVSAVSPYTTAEVVDALRTLEIRGTGVALLHYGEANDELRDALADMGAEVHELFLYEWRLPEDTSPIEDLVVELIGGKLDAILFTTQVQVRHLLQVANKIGLGSEVIDALNERTVVAAVGPTCAAALRSVGVEVSVVPENPKMGPMLIALGTHLGGG